MKLYARRWRHSNAPIIDALEAIKLRDNPYTDAGKEFYDLSFELAPMTVVQRGDKVFFKYKDGYGGKTGRSSRHMSVVHETTQRMFLSEPVITFIGGKTSDPFKMKLDVEAAELEYSVVLEGRARERRFWVDVILRLMPNSPYFEIFDGLVGVEVHNTNRVANLKTKAFRAVGLTVFEINVFKDWVDVEHAGLTTKSLRELELRISGALRKGISVRSVGKFIKFEELRDLE